MKIENQINTETEKGEQAGDDARAAKIILFIADVADPAKEKEQGWPDRNQKVFIDRCHSFSLLWTVEKDKTAKEYKGNDPYRKGGVFTGLHIYHPSQKISQNKEENRPDTNQLLPINTHCASDPD